jgi:hypothetical protein
MVKIPLRCSLVSSKKHTATKDIMPHSIIPAMSDVRVIPQRDVCTHGSNADTTMARAIFMKLENKTLLLLG